MDTPASTGSALTRARHLQRTGDPDAVRCSLGPEVKGLQKATLAKDTFEVGESIPVTYVVKNVSKAEQVLWHSGFWPNRR
jgi:hypothetical protein